MKYLGIPYLKGKTGAIVSKKVSEAVKDTLGAGVLMALSPTDVTGETVAVYTGVSPYIGISAWNKKALCLFNNIPCKDIILEDSYNVFVRYTGSTAQVGGVVYAQADGTVGDVDAGFGSFIVMMEPQNCIDWDQQDDNSENNGVPAVGISARIQGV